MSDRWRSTATVDILVKRSDLLRSTRAFFDERNIVEVQTASLDRFGVTDPAIANIQVPGFGELQSSPEFQMKRLLAAGMPSCYQLAPAFREGEIGRWHNAEFTMLEWYELDIELEQLMTNVAALVDRLLGTGNYETTTIGRLLEEAFGLDPLMQNEASYVEMARANGLLDESDAQLAFDFLVSSAMSQITARRVFLTDYPEHQAALAKTHTVNGIRVASRFELVVDGLEVANGYDELQDVDEYRRRCIRDNQQRKAFGLPEKSIDPHFEAAMAAGLPACCGVAVGFDRLVALALGEASLARVQAFGSTFEA